MGETLLFTHFKKNKNIENGEIFPVFPKMRILANNPKYAYFGNFFSIF